MLSPFCGYYKAKNAIPTGCIFEGALYTLRKRSSLALDQLASPVSKQGDIERGLDEYKTGYLSAVLQL